MFESDFKAYYESLKNRDSPDCIRVVSASDKHIYIWNAAMGDLEGHVMHSLRAVVIPESRRKGPKDLVRGDRPLIAIL